MHSIADRKPLAQHRVAVTEVAEEQRRIYVQHAEQCAEIESLMGQIRNEFAQRPPVPGSFAARRGQMCAAQFSQDQQWYRTLVESTSKDGTVVVKYIDFGNVSGAIVTVKAKRFLRFAKLVLFCFAIQRESVRHETLAALPDAFHKLQPQAREYALAFVKDPPDVSASQAGFYK